jgi:hypothetical protein
MDSLSHEGETMGKKKDRRIFFFLINTFKGKKVTKDREKEESDNKMDTKEKGPAPAPSASGDDQDCTGAPHCEGSGASFRPLPSSRRTPKKRGRQRQKYDPPWQEDMARDMEQAEADHPGMRAVTDMPNGDTFHLEPEAAAKECGYMRHSDVPEPGSPDTHFPGTFFRDVPSTSSRPPSMDTIFPDAIPCEAPSAFEYTPSHVDARTMAMLDQIHAAFAAQYRLFYCSVPVPCERDIAQVMHSAGVSRKRAIYALQTWDGDVTNATLEFL